MGALDGKRIAVVGAGAAGLCSAKYLSAAGADVVIFEAGGYIGGLWAFNNDSGTSSAYRTLHINTDKAATAYRDFPMSSSTQYFPHHTEMYEYLNSYADHHGLRRLVRFHARVVSIRLSEMSEQRRWSVETVDRTIDDFDSVVVATGHLSDPLYPDFATTFSGEALHSHYYREPLDFANKRVCIIGVGNSACDIASDLAVIAQRTVVSARSGIKIRPKLIFGIPVTRIATLLDRPWIPRFALRRLANLITYIIHGPMEKWGLQTPDRQVHPTSNATFLAHVAYQRILVRPGVISTKGPVISFADGTEEEFDTLIMATGYKVTIPTLGSDIVKVEENALDLYKRIVPPGSEGLYLIGFVNPDAGSLNAVFEAQAAWMVALESNVFRLPSVTDMENDIDMRQARTAARYRNSPRHTLEESPREYFRELRLDIDGRWSWKSRFVRRGRELSR